MAATTVYCDTYDAQYIDVPPTIQSGAVVNGRLKRTVASITPGAIEAGSTIVVARPPKGARLSSLSKVLFEAFGAGAVLDIGIAGALEKFAKDIDISAIGNANLDILAGVDYEFDGNTDIVATTGGATLAAAKKFVFEIVYAMF